MNIPQLRFPEFKDKWNEEKMGELYSFKVTNSFSRDNLNYEEGAVKNIHYGDIHTKFQTLFDITKETVPFINSDVSIDRISEDNYCQEGDLILADASEDLNDVGKSIEIFNINNEKLLAGLHTILARPNLKKLDFGFGGYLFKSNKVRTKIQKEAQGSKVLSISATRLTNISLDFPSKDEQKKIVECFSSIDEKIQALKKKHSLLEKYKKGVMQKLFSQELRFKDENGNEFPEWEEKQVKDLFKVTRGDVLAMSLVSDEIENEHIYPVYSSQTKNRGLAGYYNEYLFEDAITWTTDGAGAGDVNFREGKFYCTNVCGVLLSDEGYANLFIAELLNSVSRKYVSYVGNPKLMNNVMAEISIIIPVSVEEQQKISNFLKSLNVRIKQLESEISKIENWKKGLLQKMFC